MSMNVEDLLNTAWGQNLSQQIAEHNDRERELQHENGNLRGQQAQLEERLDAATKEVARCKTNEKHSERQLSKFEDKTNNLEKEINFIRTQKLEIELSRQQMENEIQKLKGEVKEKEETINHITDALEKCRYDCANKDTKYLEVSNENSRLEDKFQAAVKDKSSLESEIERLHALVKTEERKQRKLQKDLITTRQVLNESFRDKNNIEKRLEADIENFKYQIFTLNKSLNEKKSMIDTLKREKGMLMFYYQDKIFSAIQSQRVQELEAVTHSVCSSALDKSVQTSLLESTTSTLNSKVINLESRIYRYEKLTEALVDIIQSYDPNFVLEENESLKAYLDHEQAFQCDKQPVCCNDLYKEPDYGNNLDLYAGCNLDLCADVCVMDHNANDDISSKSSDTCATAESFENPLFSEISSDSDIYKTSTSQSESDTSSF